MANIYVRLKEIYPDGKDKGKTITKAVDLLHKTIYPGLNRWQMYKDTQLEIIKQHKFYDLFEIKTEEDLDKEKENYDKEIEEIACMQWKKAEKIINVMNDKKKLKDILAKAQELERNMIVKLVSEKLEELSIS